MRALKAYIDTCRRFAWPLVGLVAALTLAGVWLASQLEIRADMTRLLPESAPSVAGLERLEAVYGGQIGRLTVVLTDEPTGRPDNPRLEQLADRLAGRLAQIDSIGRVEQRRPLEFFERHRLLYAELEDLEAAKARLEERIEWEKKQANPLFVGLDTDEPPEVDFEELAEQYDELAQSSHYISDDGAMLVLFAYPSFPASELAQSEELVARVERLVASELARVDEGAGVDDGTGADQVGFGLTGRYKKRVDLQAMLERDLAVSMGLALALILAFLVAFIRSLRGTLVVIVPLVVGTAWTFGWAELTFGSLNILTAFLGAVLMGLGVDYGIHLYSRLHEMLEVHELDEALWRTLASTGRANLFAALTTMVALGSLTVSDFRAFFEFGVIAVGGLLLIMVGYALLFPCLVLLAARYDLALPAPASRALTERIVARLTRGGPAAAAGRAHAASRYAKYGLIALVVAASVGLPRLEFVRDFSVLQSTSAPSWRLDERVNDLLGQSQTPAVVLTESQRETEEVVDELEARAERRPEGYTIDKVVSLSTFVPERQLAKLRLLGDIARALGELPQAARDAELGSYLQEVRQVLRSGRVSVADLPVDVRRPFSRTDSPHKSVVLVFPAIDLSDMDAVDDYARILRDLPGVDGGRGYDAVSDALLLSDIIEMAERDALWMLVITLAGLLLVSAFAFRSKTLVTLQLTVLAVALLVGLGINGLLGVDFNFMNIVVLPIWIGLGVDASFHILLHVDNGNELRAHTNVALAICAAYLTSMVGFGTLLLARHDGLLSLGQVAVIGLGSILAINLLAQMVLAADREEARDIREAPETK